MGEKSSADFSSPVGAADEGEERRVRVLRAATAWKGQLVDLSGRNTLLFYKDLRQGTLDLSPGDGALDVGGSDLLGSRTIRLSSLFPDATLPAAAKRARTIYAKAQENFEERGLQTLFLAWGMATWTNTRGTATPAAPVLLRQASLGARGGAGEDFDVALPGEWEVNPSLLHLLRTEHQVDVGPHELLDLLDDQADGAPDPDAVWERLAKAASTALPDFGVTERVVLGNFSYAKLPMVQDIEAAAESGLLASHELLAAIAGDEQARSLVRDRHGELALDEPDRVPPKDEFLVLDADASQSYAINAVVGGSDLVIQGPPGTGKSQTIANLIATLAARQKRVLFVAEKRAAIDAVLERLNHVGLGNLVLDLHDGAGSRRKLAQDLAAAMADHGSMARPDVREDQDRFVRRRDRLVSHVRALHAPRPPWDLSVFEIQARLLGLPEGYKTTLRLRGPVLEALDGKAVEPVREHLRRYVELGGLALSRGAGSPWAQAFQAGTITSTDQAVAALEATSSLARQTLPTTLDRLRVLIGACGLRAPETVDGWAELLGLLDRVAALLDQCDPLIYQAEHDGLAVALSPASRGLLARLWARLADREYRRARKTVRMLWRDNKPKSRQMYDAVLAAGKHVSEWCAKSIDQQPPRLPPDLAGAEGAYHQFSIELRAVGAFLGSSGFGGLAAEAVQEQLDGLLGDQVTLYRLPELHELASGLERRGLAELLKEASERGLQADGAVAMLDYAWLSSIMETVSLSDRDIGAFDGTAHHRTVADFIDADRDHIATGPTRVRRAVAEWAVATRDAHPTESDVVQKQARLKRRHLPVRDLFQAAPHVLGAMKPCWAMSPLVVAQLLPPERCFDIVIFDEASQVTPADAVGALLRADLAVVAGDTKQLPPTSFFASTSEASDDGEDDSSALTSGLESVLDVMSALLPVPKGTRTLTWHYRSRDEKLIAFSNAQAALYDWSLTTFPGVAHDECITHVLVPWRPGRVGQEDSVGDEVNRVVELVVEHASMRPHESLGVIAMGVKHANRITEAVRLARALHPELDGWFDRGPDSLDGKEPFFIKNLERVQGDERDAIILTVGYGKTADGRMLYRFGPLNNEGGERRLNVAITRARNCMTVVSSFSSADLDPNKLKREGVQMLRRYLAYAESSGTNLGDVAKDKPVLNPFERDVQDHLSRAGIPLIAQYGCSGYWIDFAAQHPETPGRMALAIECDGASYHSSATARDRDRLRQEHLERLGWSFHRIWSTDWFRNREAEVERAVAAWKDATAAATGRKANPEYGPRDSSPSNQAPSTTHPPASAREAGGRARGKRPSVPRSMPIGQHSQRDLVALIRWIESDTLLRTEDELLAAAMQELGYKKRGPRIIDALTEAIQTARRR